MSKYQWDQFFELVDRIVNLTMPSWQDKRDEVISQYKQREGETNFYEFIAWFGYDVDN